MMRRFSVRQSAIHGKGVFALAHMNAGDVVIEYKGRRLTQVHADRLYADDGESGHTFLFAVNDRYVIDANVGGNSARWINHGCTPNCEAVMEESAGGDPRHDRILIMAMRDIEPGEELTYNYGIVLDVAHTKRLKALWQCRCGSPQCRGTMLHTKPRLLAE